jgi:hypothetical protein
MGAHAGVRCAALVVTLLGALAEAEPARAQGAAEPGAAQAAAVFEEAKQAFDRKQYDVACLKFLQSYELDRTKVGVLYALAECYAEAGKIASAIARYREYAQAAGVLPPAALAKHLDRIEHAKSQQSALAPEVPEVTIVVRGAGAAGARVTLDGNELQEASLKSPQALDPGEHRVVVTPREGAAIERVFRVKRGEKKPLELEVGTKAVAAPSSEAQTSLAGSGSKGPTSGSAPSDGISARRVGAYAAFGVGAAGLIAMGITGGIVLANKGAVHDGCPADLGDDNGGCATQDDADRGNLMYSLSVVSTVSLGVAIAGGALGTVLLVTEPKKAERAGTPRWVALAPISISERGVIVGAVGAW